MSIETMSQGQDKKNKIPQLHFRLFDFNIYEEELDNLDGDSGCNSDDSEEYKKKKDDKGLTIQMFGINELGETCTIFIRDYQPFFYVKVGDDWSMEHKRSFINRIKTSNEVGKYYEDSIIENECKLIKRKKLYGFDGGKEHKFIKLVFKNTTTMNKVKNLWYEKGRDGKMNLKKSGFIFDYTSTTIYESNIPPLLRYFHIKEISPSGWISIPKYKSKTPGIKKTTCKFEYELKTSDITPLNDKETIVPYKICSFDIEASSSHGDFPLAVKSYKKLAINIIDIYNNLKKNEEEMTKEIMYRIICSAFGHDNYDDVDIVYTKKKLSVEETTEKFKIWFEKHIEDIEEKENEIAYTNTIENMFEKMIANNKDIDNGNYGDDDDDDDDAENNEENFDIDEIENYESKQKNTISDKKKTKPKTIITVLDLLKNDKIDRDIKIEKINNLIQSIFPKVEGDKVTFIGSTFLKYGNKRPYLNHCITLDSCNDLSDEVTNSIIESYDTERDVLLAWTRLIQKENPDIIIGYNICGFDYEFMFRRALENNCEKQFLLLSRNNNEFCATKDIKTGELSIEKNSIVIASGQHDLHFIKMNGRLQIDLYNYFRRDYNLTSYKLDYCAGYFIGDGVKKIEHLDEPKRTKIYSSNLMGLENGNYVVFEENSHSTESYKDGTKFKVFNVDETSGTFEIPGIETPDMKKSVRWGFAKDDVTPQDMFRMTKEGPKERAIIAKYCIQDCNLVHHLMNKIDVMTGYIEMSKICSVPISFLVMRGQGIKLTSFIAKKCREKKTLMPVVEKSYGNESYEGAIVLPPKCNLYLDNPVACLDYSSLYPSSMISENLSHDSKVWTKEYNLNGELIRETGEKDGSGNYIYDNLPKYDYVDVTYDTYKWIPNERGKAVKTVSGKKICRFAQPTDGSKAIMPSVLEELLAARKATRKLAEAADDPFIANILDKRQLGYKVTANSLYGQCGAKTSTFYEVDVAASTTATGRKLLTYGKRIVEEVYGDTTVESKKFGFVNTKAEYIYGDSVANYTPVYVRENGGPLLICTIDDLSNLMGDKNGWIKCTEEGKQEKEFHEMRENVETWSEKGWTKLHRVIRHTLAEHKKMVRVVTHKGVVDVTDDHSLVLDNGNEISPKDVTIGTKLLHKRIPEEFINENNTSFDDSIDKCKSCVNVFPNDIVNEIHRKYKEICDFDNSICDCFSTKNQLNAAKYWMKHCNNSEFSLFIKREFTDLNRVLIEKYYANMNILPLHAYNSVIQLHEIEYPKGEYVYDLTTENHHFAAGVGNLIVHNTDSVFFTFNLATPDGIPIRGKDALEITIEIAQQVGHLATKFLKSPHAWVYEKTLMPFCLLSKKRYVGMLYETTPEKPKRKSMGIVLKRRDNAPIVKDIYGGIIDILMKEQNVEQAIKFLKECLNNMVQEKYPLEKLIITKSLRSGYKNPAQIAHKVLADRMGKRDPGNKPSVGDRIPFVYIHNENKKALQGEKIEHPNYIIANKLRPNYSFYITNQIMKPVQQVFALVLENIEAYKKKIPQLEKRTESIKNTLYEEDKIQKKITELRNKEVKALLFDDYLTMVDNANKKNQSIMNFFKKK